MRSIWRSQNSFRRYLWKFTAGLCSLFVALAVASAGQAAFAAEGGGGLVKGPVVTVKSVVDGDTLVINEAVDGASQIRLVGIQAPKLPLGRRGFRKWPLADEAKAELSQLTLGRKLILSYGGRRMDRHGRLLAHLHRQDGVWVQGEMLKRGFARVYSFADNRAKVEDMLAAERHARQRRSGLWRHPFYTVQDAAEIKMPVNSFQLVEGRMLDVAVVRGRVYLNFGANWRTDFTISIAPKVARLFKREGIDLSALKARSVRVRGWLKSFNGPIINATHPEQIEVLKP